MFGFGKNKEKSLGELINSPEAPKPAESKQERRVERTSMEDFHKLGEMRMMVLESKAKSAGEAVKGWFSGLKKRAGGMLKSVGGALKTGAEYATAAPEMISYAGKVAAEGAKDLKAKADKAVSETGNVNYDRVISMNLSGPATAETKSGKFESVMAALDSAPEKAAQRIDKITASARERINQVKSKYENRGSLQSLNLNISAEQAQAHQQRDVEAVRPQVEAQLAELAPSPKVTHVMEAGDLNRIENMAQQLGISYKMNVEIGRAPAGMKDRYERPPAADNEMKMAA